MTLVSSFSTGAIAGRNCASTISTLAALSLIMKASSGPVSRKFSGTKIAPSRSVANIENRNID